MYQLTLDSLELVLTPPQMERLVKKKIGLLIVYFQFDSYQSIPNNIIDIIVLYLTLIVE